ncbi:MULTISPECIES: pyocin knob domain-containing protein [unclassified Microcoleus]|uniref:pyocin knob domain-containing protein n=1 Tax=unclassified Microcoleus TaxID=2642155 RepID=UPI002FD5C13C
MTVPDTITRTFPLVINNTYVTNTVLELFHLRDMSFDADERVAVYLEAWFCNLNLKSFQPGIIPEFEGDETEREKMSLFTAAENKSQKIGLQILDRKNNIGNWEETAEIILVNRERKDYFDLMQPYLTKNPVRLLEKNDAFGIKLIDYGNGLLKIGDRIKITLGVTITIAKKNNLDIFNARLATIETAITNYLTEVLPGNVLGRDTTTGTIQLIPQSRFATQTDIDQVIVDIVGGSPGALDTLKELATALNNDATFATNITNQLALKANTSELAKYYPQRGYTSNNPDTVLPGIEGGDKNLGEGLAGWHFITNLRAGNTYGIQLAICDTSRQIKYRYKVNNTWQAWIGVYTGNNSGLSSKTIIGTTANSQGGAVITAHGLIGSKISNVEGIVRFSATGTVPLNGIQPNYQSWISTDGPYLSITNVPNSSSGILSLPFEATIWYSN